MQVLIHIFETVLTPVIPEAAEQQRAIKAPANSFYHLNSVVYSAGIFFKGLHFKGFAAEVYPDTVLC